MADRAGIARALAVAGELFRRLRAHAVMLTWVGVASRYNIYLNYIQVEYRMTSKT